jgi:predicted dehydrogenase
MAPRMADNGLAAHPSRVRQEPVEKLSVGVVGYGYWGPNIVRNFHTHPDTRVAFICDRSPSRQQLASQSYPELAVTGDYQAALAAPDLDAVAIATPIETHYSLARAALEAGKHTWIEKPMAATSAEASDLLALASKQGVILHVDHTFLFHGAIGKARELLDRGELGEVLYFDSVRTNLGLFQQHHNVIWDLAPHDLAIMLYLLAAQGKRPDRVSAFGQAHFGQSLEDIAYLTLGFPDATIAHFHVNWISPAKIRLIVVGGTRRMLVIDDMSASEKVRIYDKGVIVQDTPLPADSDAARQLRVQYRSGDMIAPTYDTSEPLRTEVTHFVGCCREQVAAISPGELGLEVVRMLEAAQRSLQEGNRPVAL